MKRWDPLAGGAGFVILEVLVAVVLVGLVVASLGAAFAASVEQARTARRLAGAESEAAGSDARTAWEWGPRVIGAWWRPGPVLHVRISAVADGSEALSHVGLWADGWLIEEKIVGSDGVDEAGATGEVQVDTQTWSGLTDHELMIRVREGDGVWGPPWRLAVAGPAGGDPALGSPLGAPASGPTVVAHRPGTGSSSLMTSWSAGGLASPPFGVLFALDPAVSGWGGATLDGRSQWWWMEGGRSVDLYF